MANTTWSVTPSDGVINIGNGVFSFPENTTSVDIEYTVSFYSEACGCNCSKTVVIEAAPCKCTVTSNYGDEEHAIGPEAGTDVVVGTIDNCADEVTWEKIDGGEFVGNISVNENNEIVVASISENGGGARYAEYSASCDSILTIWQKKHTGCPSESTIIQTIGRLPDTGGTGITIFKILKNDAYTGYNFSGDTNNIITNFDVSDDDVDNWYNVTANVAANDGGERPIYIKVRLNGGTSVPDEGCLYDSVKLTQKGKCVIEWLGDEECVMCDCSSDDFLLNTTSVSIDSEGYNDIIGTVGDCIDKTTMELRNNTWGENTVKLQYLDENNNIYLVVTGNDGAAREETVKIAYSATCGEDGVVWEKSLTLRQEGSTCACSDLSFNGIDYDNPVIVTIYNSYSNVMYAFDVGLKVNDTWKKDQIGQEEGEIDYGKENVVTVFDYRDSDIGKTITNASATIGQTPQDQGMKYCRMECTPTTITSGAVIRLTWDGDWSGRYHSCDDSTPIPSSFDYKLSIVKPSAKTTPVVQFYTSNGTYAGGYGRVNANTVVNSTWSSEGTITKMVFAENYSDISRVTVKDNNGNNLINNQPLNGTITTLYLINNINTSDYTGGTKTINVSFS